MVSAFIKYKQSGIHYLYFGNGSTAIVCLHGYGEHAESFGFLNERLPNAYCLIAIDLPFHGTTLWNEERAFTNNDLELILKAIFKASGLKDHAFIIMGYSMGGRIALSLFEHMPHSISRLILLAPDGLKVNFWYWLATQTQTGNLLFRFTMNNPGLLLKLAQISGRFKLINKSAFKFINSYMDDENARKQLYHRWTCLRTFKPNLKNTRALIQQKQLPVRMLYGKHDRIILSKRGGSFRKDLESSCEVYVIDAGHQVLQKKYTLVITELFTR